MLRTAIWKSDRPPETEACFACFVDHDSLDFSDKLSYNYEIGGSSPPELGFCAPFGVLLFMFYRLFTADAGISVCVLQIGAWEAYL